MHLILFLITASILFGQFNEYFSARVDCFNIVLSYKTSFHGNQLLICLCRNFIFSDVLLSHISLTRLSPRGDAFLSRDRGTLYRFSKKNKMRSAEKLLTLKKLLLEDKSS